MDNEGANSSKSECRHSGVIILPVMCLSNGWWTGLSKSSNSLLVAGLQNLKKKKLYAMHEWAMNSKGKKVRIH